MTTNFRNTNYGLLSDAPTAEQQAFNLFITAFTTACFTDVESSSVNKSSVQNALTEANLTQKQRTQPIRRNSSDSAVG